VDIVHWIDARLTLLQKKTAGITPAHINEAARLVARQTAKRTSPHRAVFRHLQEQEARRTFLSWAGAIGVGVEPAFSLYTADSALAAAFDKGLGAKGAPDDDLQLEKMSVPRLRDILTKATAEEVEQARRDCKTISDLVKLAENVDWRRVRARLEVPRQGVSEGHSGPIEPFERLISLWRSFHNRAVAIPYLIFVRRLPGYRYELDETFASKAVELRALADIAAEVRDSVVAAPGSPNPPSTKLSGYIKQDIENSIQDRKARRVRARG
jgi:hypothetical protein